MPRPKLETSPSGEPLQIRLSHPATFLDYPDVARQLEDLASRLESAHREKICEACEEVPRTGPDRLCDSCRLEWGNDED